MRLAKEDPNLLFFGNWVDASSRLSELERFLDYTSAAYTNELKWLEERGHTDLDTELGPLFAEDLPSILYTAVAISTASLLERELRGIAEALQEALELKLSFGDLKGSLIERFWKYTVRLAMLLDDVPEAQWQEVKAVYEIRNCLVHAGGDLSQFRGSSVIKAFAERNQMVFVKDERIVLDRVNVQRLVRITETFLERVYRAAIERFPGYYG